MAATLLLTVNILSGIHPALLKTSTVGRYRLLENGIYNQRLTNNANNSSLVSACLRIVIPAYNWPAK
jgi:hypothetical protein